MVSDLMYYAMLTQHRGREPSYRQKVLEWKCIRYETKRKLLDIADSLEKSRREHVENKYSDAKTSLASSCIGFGGVLLAPFSGGLSVGAAAVATGLSVKTTYSSYVSNKRDSEATERKIYEASEVLKQYNPKSHELLEVYKTIEEFEEMDIIVQVHDVMVKIHHAKRKIARGIIRRTRTSLNDVKHHSGNTMSSDKIGAMKSLVFMNAALNNSQTVTQIACHTERISRQTILCKEIISVAKSIREIGTSVRPEALANVALQYGSLASISQPVSQVTMLPNGFQMVNGMLSSASGAGLNAVVSGSKCAVNSFKQSTNTLNAAVTAKSGKTTLDAVVNAQKTTRITKSVSQTAIGSDKVVRITRASKTVKESSKVSATVTKAASISKVGVALSMVAIPLDIYNIVTAEQERETTPEEVKKIRDTAEQLGNEMLEITGMIESFEEMHIEVLRVYKEARVEILHEFLTICHEKLNLELPAM